MINGNSDLLLKREMSHIYILPIGDVAPEILDGIDQEVVRYFKTQSRLLSPMRVPLYAKDKKRNQYLADIVLKEISLLDFPEAERVVGIISADIYTADLNYIFGQAESPGRNTLVSLFRLDPEYYKEKPNLDLLRDRVIKEIFHELGHAYNLSHCPDKDCVMYFSQTVTDIDIKQGKFCQRCQKLYEIYNS